MAKIIYKTVGLILVFIGALFFFGSRLKTEYEVTGEQVVMEKESFPILMVETQGHLINPLYGYASQISPNVVRESITPLGEDKTLTLHLSEGKNYLTELTYRIIDKESGEVYDTQTVKGFTSDQKEVRLVLSYALSGSTEYIMDIAGQIVDGQEIHYYTRLKYYLDDSGLDAKLAFAKQFHEDTFHKNKMEEVAKYLEPNPEKRNTSLAEVTISSSSDLVTWAGMAPKIVSDEYITICEYNFETACIQYNYFVKANTNSGTENYQIKESYRVRHTPGRDYLLAFSRTMEAAFDPALASLSNSQLKLGITDKTDSKLLPKNDGKGLYFTRGGVLYYYDMAANTMHTIYRINSEDASYLQRAYNENEIRLIAVDEEDALYFSVFGYHPRGAYEGDVGIVLYRYDASGELEELVNLPMDTSYRQLSLDFETYGYVSPRDVFYFTVANTVYAYNISGKRLEMLQENVKDISFRTMETANCYVWSSSLSKGYGDSVTIYNLKNDEHQLIQSPSEDSYIRLLGTIERNVVYGIVRKEDIRKQQDGTKIIPCYRLVICDTDGKQVKTYEPEGLYIRDAVGSGNVVNIRLCKKRGDKYVNAGEDSILNRSTITDSKFSYVSRVTTKSLTEWYIRFPSSFTMPGQIKTVEDHKNITTNGRVERIEPPAVTNYYVSALGKYTKSTEDVRKAIRTADKQMGVVISSNHQLVWERSGAYNQNNLGDMSLIRSSLNRSNLACCAAMVIGQVSEETVSAEQLTTEGLTLYEMLEKYLDHPLNLKGCTLDQIIYFVSNNKPVIAMTSDNKAVVITGYTLNKLTILDPEKGEKSVGRSEYAKVFESAGNRFLSFMY